jgi:hypothetical protein
MWLSAGSRDDIRTIRFDILQLDVVSQLSEKLSKEMAHCGFLAGD